MKKFLLVTLMCASFSGCASIVNDDTDNIVVTSSNNKSFIAMVDGKSFTVPGSVSIERDGDEKTITTNESGCAQNTTIEKKMDTAFVGNVITGGPFGSSTDYGTGKMWDYQSNVVIACTN